MTLPTALQDREMGKFTDVGGSPAVRVTTIGGFAPASYDEISVTYPTSTTEVYAYKLASVTQVTVTITYSDSTKANITSVVRT